MWGSQSRVSRIPRGEGQSGALASRLEDKPRGHRALRGLLPAGPFLSHFSRTGAHNLLALFLSFPLELHSSRATARASPPSPTIPACRLLRSRPPWLCRRV